MATLFASWKTTVCGLLTLICAGTALTEALPLQYGQYVHPVCTILLALGLIAAKDANVSNAPNPDTAKKVE